MNIIESFKDYFTLPVATTGNNLLRGDTAAEGKN